jgi:hypothetical protein
MLPFPLFEETSEPGREVPLIGGGKGKEFAIGVRNGRTTKRDNARITFAVAKRLLEEVVVIKSQRHLVKVQLRSHRCDLRS